MSSSRCLDYGSNLPHTLLNPIGFYFIVGCLKIITIDHFCPASQPKQTLHWPTIINNHKNSPFNISKDIVLCGLVKQQVNGFHTGVCVCKTIDTIACAILTIYFVVCVRFFCLFNISNICWQLCKKLCSYLIITFWEVHVGVLIERFDSSVSLVI